MNKILILGAYGYLGQYLSIYLSKKYTIVRQGRKKNSELSFNPTVYEEFYKNISMVKPNIIINLIAETNVDRCEINKYHAKKINTTVVQNLSNIIEKINEEIYLIQISTDQVYSGIGPHLENKVKPLNEYARSKLKGEKYAENVPSAIIRTNFIGKNKLLNKKSLSDWIISSLQNKKKISVFNDVLFNPLHISTLCSEIDRVIIKKFNGIINLGAKDPISKAKFALQLSNLLDYDENLLSFISSNDKNFRAVRSKNMFMNVDKYESAFKVNLPNISDEIIKTANQYR